MPVKRWKLFSRLFRRRGLIYLACIVIAFGQAGLFIGRRVASMVDLRLEVYADTEVVSSKNWLSLASGSLSASVITEHPIPKLMADAEVQFRKLLSEQSHMLKAAVSEYQRRYKRNPPNSFDKWWRFAKENDVKVVDEYDGLVEDLAPFWEISGQEFRRRALQVSWGHLLTTLAKMRKGWFSARYRSSADT
jgi:hypothetical protein